MYLLNKVKKVYTLFVYDTIYTTLEYLDIKGEKVAHHTAVDISRLSLFASKHDFKIFTEEGKVTPFKSYGVNVKLVEHL